jgi:hypothetical protein
MLQVGKKRNAVIDSKLPKFALVKIIREASEVFDRSDILDAALALQHTCAGKFEREPKHDRWP